MKQLKYPDLRPQGNLPGRKKNRMYRTRKRAMYAGPDKLTEAIGEFRNSIKSREDE